MPSHTFFVMCRRQALQFDESSGYERLVWKSECANHTRSNHYTVQTCMVFLWTTMMFSNKRERVRLHEVSIGKNTNNEFSP